MSEDPSLPILRGIRFQSEFACFQPRSNSAEPALNSIAFFNESIDPLEALGL